MAIPILTLSPAWTAQEQYVDLTNESILGDGWTINGPSSISPRVEWTISRVGLTQSEVDDLVDQLSAWAGVTSFYWQPEATVTRKLYFCTEWTETPLGNDTYEFSTRFIEDIRGECVSYAQLIPENDLTTQINNASTFITSLSGNSGNYLINSDNNLILRSLHTHGEQIPSDSGRLYDQLTLALACIRVYEFNTASIWLTRAINYAQAIVDNYYNSSSGTLLLPHWLYDIKTNNRLEDIYPTSRSLTTGEVNSPLGWLPMLWELYTKLSTLDSGNSQWATLATRTQTDAIAASTFTNQVFIYRKSTGVVTEYPGTSITGSATRETVLLGLTNFVDVTGTGNLVVQNTEIAIATTNTTTYSVEAATENANTIIDFFVSTITDDSSDTSLYRQFWRLGSAETAAIRVFNSYELFRWDDLTWFYGVGLESGAANYESQTFSYNSNSLTNVVLRLAANAQLTLNKTARTPFKLFTRVTGNPGTLRLQDEIGNYWDYILPVADWSLLEPTWDDFTWSSANLAAQGSTIPSSNGDIQSLEILTSDFVYVWWIGSAAPNPLPVPAIAYRAGVRDLNTGTRHLYVGDVKPVNSSSNDLTYTPGVVPFARNITAGTAGALTGLPYAGYQNVWGWVKWNQTERLTNAIAFLKASQVAYATAIDDTGPFAPVYTWNDPENSSSGGDLNTFGFNGFDDLETSGEYQAQVGAWLSRAWYENQANADLKELTMNWLKWLDQVYATRDDTLPPITFSSSAVAVGGHNPGVQALIGEAALWANLAGGDPAVTFRWIYRSLVYLNTQYLDTGDMAGSWSNDQSTFASTLKNYYSWWHGSILNYYSLLLTNKVNITYPPCSEPIAIATSDPIPETCCSGPIVELPPSGGY